MDEVIKAYNDKQTSADKAICSLLDHTIDKELSEAESKLWHAHSVWFSDGNPIASVRVGTNGNIVLHQALTFFVVARSS
jgi:hypothetical protein